MPKRRVKNDEEDEDREDSVAIIDDDEDNEDLSLKILEKALSRRELGNKLDSDLSDSGLVNGRTSQDKNFESNKKMKRNKLKSAHEIPNIWKDQYIEKSAEPKTGETSSNLVMKKLLRGERYFDPCDDGSVSCCYSCGEHGHITINCPTPTKRRKPCFRCGSLERGARQCSKRYDCYICNEGGHRAKDCTDKYKSGSKEAVCLRCGGFGHDMILCKYEYSHEDLKDIQCYVCKSFGHLCCIEPCSSSSWAVSCYRCGQLGHTGLACGRHYHDEINGNDFDSSSASIRTSRGRESPSLCYECNGAGHLARECPNSSQDKLDIHLTRNFNLMQSIDELLSQ